jgi:hypothetical protein
MERLIKKLPMGITIVLAVSLSIFLMAETADAIASEHKPYSMPSYSGFAEIQGAKKRFLIVGDTQSTSRWDFWRERNDKERKLIIDEITGREPAFVIHLGDLATRGSSEKHWQEFEQDAQRIPREEDSLFPDLKQS